MKRLIIVLKLVGFGIAGTLVCLIGAPVFGFMVAWEEYKADLRVARGSREVDKCRTV